MPLKNNLTLHGGNLCRLVAIGNLLNYYSETKAISSALPPMRKQPDNNTTSPTPHPISLRQIAKETTEAKVGEFYTTNMVKQFIVGLGKKLKDSKIENAVVEFKRFDSSERTLDYVSHVKKEFDNGRPPIVYYDVNTVKTDDYGQPLQNGNGDSEHAALVVGYCYQDKKLSFVLAHVGKFTIVNAEQLAVSASRLMHTRESPQTFYKIRSKGHTTRWCARLSLFSERYKDVFAKIEEATKNNNMDPETIQREDKSTIILFKRKGFVNKAKDPGFQSTVCTIQPIEGPSPQIHHFQIAQTRMYK